MERVIPPAMQCNTPSDSGLPIECTPPTPAEAAEAVQANDVDREPTAGEIRTAVREVPMPPLRLVVEPGDATLVGLPTIFHTESRQVEREVTLLGTEVLVEATPSLYTWHHGDGTSQTTDDPGRPYPAQDVAHRYTRAADAVQARVDTTYTVRYRVDGGPWTPLGDTLTATGPSTTFGVDQAAPVLTQARR